MFTVINILRTFGVRTWLWAKARVWWIAAAAGVLLVLIFIAPAYADVASHGKIYTAADVPKHEVAIVFGAGVYPDGTPTPFLESRLFAAITLFKTGKARVLLVSGDNRTTHYDEPTAMKKFVVAHEVPARAVVEDYAGYDTYDTCYRAHNIFGVNSAILVTHGYHLPRALLTCNDLGVNSVGVKADRSDSGFSKNYLLREVLSINKAVVQLFFKPKPAVLGPKVDSVKSAYLSAN